MKKNWNYLIGGVTMKILIKETGKIEDLKIRDSNDIEWSPDFGNKETEIYEMEQQDFDYLQEYINNNEATGVVLAYKGNYRTCRRIRKL